ncbi:acyl-CoA dehydrogenase family protein [Georgenia sp. SYP-B2076]|uniref:acyl-CoA dehydrogenase family protein n=1 Tax=Georgenia sp. SYP-B2076 TaxID=2495881 RepID=UPI000F8C8575|nr:acyl-CoA dehydrogenase family protein [Georgenia sp. SYP-B2076]
MSAVLAEELTAYRDAVKAFVRSHATSDRVRESFSSSDGVDAVAWARAAEQLGLQGLLVPEDLGGSGADVAVAVVAHEELGAALLPGPYLGSTLAAFALSWHGAQRFGPEIAGLLDGSIVVTTALPQVTLEGTVDPSGLVSMAGPGDEVVLDGTVPAVAHAAGSHVLVLLIGAPSQWRLAVVDLAAAEVDVEQLDALDLTTPMSTVTLSGASARTVPLDDDDVVELLDLASVLVGAEQLGLLREVLDRDVAYALERTAFGREIGSFQAVKHQLAEFACLFEQSRAMLDAAVLAFDGPAAARSLAAVSVAAFVGPASVTVATEGLRLLGGIGYTWEHDAHLFYRRARGAEALLGNPYGHRERLAALLGLNA